MPQAANFNPRTPCGVRPAHAPAAGHINQISIHAPRAGCDAKTPDMVYDEHISIHAPRAGCDSLVLYDSEAGSQISIHAPRAGCDI